jgi:hypothetical protein
MERGSNVGTGVGRPSPSTATKIIRHCVAGSRPPVVGGPELTCTVTCMLVRPVSTTRARASTRSPTSTGRLKRTLPT